MPAELRVLSRDAALIAALMVLLRGSIVGWKAGGRRLDLGQDAMRAHSAGDSATSRRQTSARELTYRYRAFDLLSPKS
ncbi:hypothetical protein [Inquilinus limosus]|uniref:hypothetical protein n=1 Tax=Inquilinus limosus TaxID=171674 RepID=UPI0012DEA38C|nr:hypothetical protein [Inquilinus limosus]